MSSSRRKHHQDSSSGPLTSSRDERPSHSRHEVNPLAGCNTHVPGSVYRPQQLRSSEAFLDKSRVQPNQSVLPSANFRDNTKMVSAYTTPEDVKMAEKQRNYKSLPPAKQQEQDKWAQQKLIMYDNTCPMGFGFVPHYQVGYEGYRCQGGTHLVTHELLAEGKGGLYTIDGRVRGAMGQFSRGQKASSTACENPPWLGPMYKGPDGRHNAAVPGGPSVGIPYFMGFGVRSRGEMQDPSILPGYGGENRSSPLLDSRYFKDGLNAGPSNTPKKPTPSSSKEHPEIIPVSYMPSHGGKGAPDVKTHPREGETDLTIYAKPGAHNYDRGYMESFTTFPYTMVGNPKYRANYSTIPPQDRAMAERQLRIDTLNPAERAIQKQWAKGQLKRGEFCPQGYSWWTFKTDEPSLDGKKIDGYRCWAGGHMVTHELLVEDKGKYYNRQVDRSNKDMWYGPMFPKILNGGGPKERGEPRWKKDPNFVWGGLVRQ